jgi:hypothetical protein
MSIPDLIQALIQNLDQNLNEAEQKAYQVVNLVRPLLSRFPENLMLMRHFSYFNNVILFIDIARNKTQFVIDYFSIEDLTEEAIQEIGEDLGELLGRIIEAKIGIENILKTLEYLS